MILRLYEPILAAGNVRPERFAKDAKTQLQEFLQSLHEKIPVYSVVSTTGAAHEQTFCCGCRIGIGGNLRNGNRQEPSCCGTGCSCEGARPRENSGGIEKMTEEKTETPFKCGYVAVIGRPNVGKSTLINAIVGEKVSITSKKPQTTRDRVLGVVTYPDAQLIFMDTPGFQSKYTSQLLTRMNRTVRNTLAEVDAVLFLIDAQGWRQDDLTVLKLLNPKQTNVILVLNKIDQMKNRDALLPLMAESMQKFPFAAIVPVSAEKNKRCNEVVDEVKKLLPESVPYYDPDMYTDRSPRFSRRDDSGKGLPSFGG